MKGIKTLNIPFSQEDYDFLVKIKPAEISWNGFLIEAANAYAEKEWRKLNINLKNIKAIKKDDVKNNYPIYKGIQKSNYGSEDDLKVFLYKFIDEKKKDKETWEVIGQDNEIIYLAPWHL
ncbi:MAG: hypothetical protein FIB08_02525 [Candidatus Methanoperedens sp.]|nr:hypothetical protein [Candidatus Methanoperedens sp.]